MSFVANSPAVDWDEQPQRFGRQVPPLRRTQVSEGIPLHARDDTCPRRLAASQAPAQFVVQPHLPRQQISLRLVAIVPRSTRELRDSP